MKKSRYPSISEINITNLVDVTLVLLIIFMITAPLLQSGMDVKLPASRSEDLTPQEGVTVTLTREGKLYLNTEPVDEERFEIRLFELYAESGRETVLLKADEAIPYGRVIRVMDKIKRAGIVNVGLIVQPEPEA